MRAVTQFDTYLLTAQCQLLFQFEMLHIELLSPEALSFTPPASQDSYHTGGQDTSGLQETQCFPKAPHSGSSSYPLLATAPLLAKHSTVVFSSSYTFHFCLHALLGAVPAFSGWKIEQYLGYKIEQTRQNSNCMYSLDSFRGCCLELTKNTTCRELFFYLKLKCNCLVCVVASYVLYCFFH